MQIVASNGEINRDLLSKESISKVARTDSRKLSGGAKVMYRKWSKIWWDRTGGNGLETGSAGQPQPPAISS